MATPMILVPTQSIISETTQLTQHMSDLDRGMSEVLKQDLDDSVKAKKYLLLLQKFLRYSSVREEVRSRPISVTDITRNIEETPYSTTRNIDETSIPITTPMWEDDTPVVVRPLRRTKAGRVSRLKKNPMKDLSKRLSLSPMKTRRWKKY